MGGDSRIPRLPNLVTRKKRGGRHRGSSDEATLRVARRTAVSGGLAATGLAVLLPSVIVALSVFCSLLTVTLFVPVIAALYSRWAGSFEALATIVAGAIGLTAAVIAGDGVLPDFLTPSATGVIVLLVVFVVVLLLRTKKAAPQVAP